jgi:bacitracin transport system ATP-binding protein
METEIILKTENLTKKYKNQIAVNNLNINVKKGRIYALLGRNGAGKTTTLRMIMNLVHSTSGDFYLFGQDGLSNSKDIYHRIGSLIEAPGFYENLSGYENLKLLANLRGIHRNDAVDYALSRTGLINDKNKKFKHYSMGMKQRLSIASAIMHEPELLILDEPINGLDPIGIQQIRLFLRKLVDENNVTIVISSHILSEIEQLADDIGIIHQGILIEENTLEALKSKNRKFIEIELSDENKAAVLLEEKMKIKSFEIYDNKTLRIFSNFNEIDKINRLFIENGIEVSKLFLNKEKLEDYFKKLIGGTDIA